MNVLTIELPPEHANHARWSQKIPRVHHVAVHAIDPDRPPCITTSAITVEMLLFWSHKDGGPLTLQSRIRRLGHAGLFDDTLVVTPEVHVSDYPAVYDYLCLLHKTSTTHPRTEP